ncbi:MAG: hypothetical protein FWG77_07860 [Treponema sp.]|nr:hypothetical protein [Treponema sp.]
MELHSPYRLKERILPILINRTSISFFIICLFTLFLYAAGTAQGFIDSTQFTLLSFYVIAGIFLGFSALAGFIINMGRLIKNKKKSYFFRACGYLFLVIFSIITILIVMAILAISEGNI